MEVSGAAMLRTIPSCRHGDCGVAGAATSHHPHPGKPAGIQLFILLVSRPQGAQKKLQAHREPVDVVPVWPAAARGIRKQG